jgi:hypothetical protein
VERKVHGFVDQKFLWKWSFILVGFFCHVVPAYCSEAIVFLSFIGVPLQTVLSVRAIGLIEFCCQYTVMDALIDDVGSFPLPQNVNRETFDNTYRLAREAFVHGRDPRKDEFLQTNFCKVTLDAFKKKWLTGLDVINYPAQYGGMPQVSDVIHSAMEKGSFVVDETHAILPEVQLIKEEAKPLSEEMGKKIPLRVCLFGPMEQYLKEIGAVAHPDVLDGFAETIRR